MHSVERELFGTDAGDNIEEAADDFVDRNGQYIGDEGAGQPRAAPAAAAPLPCTPPNVLSALSRLVHDEVLIISLTCMLSGMGPDGRFPNTEHMWVMCRNGQFMLRDVVRRLFSERLINCASLVWAALNDRSITTHIPSPDAMSTTVPIASLEETGIALPSILLFLAPNWELRDAFFDSQDEIERFIRCFYNAFVYAECIYGKILASSIRLSEISVCNPAAAMEMDQEEFLLRVGVPGRTCVEIEKWFEDVIFEDEMGKRSDLACAVLFSEQVVSTFLMVADNTDVALVPRYNRQPNHGDVTRVYVYSSVEDHDYTIEEY
ncbi:hypothetical protein B0H12DRAFT_1075405 [Mycena haematopus]|nr:hypothetical protein B0H12DRAFT_1075405 [Mycena haematopus]